MPSSAEYMHYYAIVLGRLGGHARAARLTPEQRSRIARNAVLIRWERHRERKTVLALEAATPQTREAGNDES